MADELFDPELAQRLFPWIKHLPKDEWQKVFDDLIATVVQSEELGSTTASTLERLFVELNAWKATSEVYADPELLQALKDRTDLDDPAEYIKGEFVEAPRPVKPKKPVRRCGASLPNPDGDKDWRYCVKPENHAGSHEGDDEGASVFWKDGDCVEVTLVEEIYSVPHHVHSYVGDQDECQAYGGCPLNWRASRTWHEEWKELQEEAESKCPSNIPDPFRDDSAFWCVQQTGHSGLHIARTGQTWTDAEAKAREFFVQVDVPQQRSGDDG